MVEIENRVTACINTATSHDPSYSLIEFVDVSRILKPVIGG
jgi:hypothetical protein